ncbi:MAG: hypothetical protein M5R36_01450 [Deltaproteobacteria bacterium]|nr:hypothetical protein [Deltaproteobacteria bacterium]
MPKAARIKSASAFVRRGRRHLDLPRAGPRLRSAAQGQILRQTHHRADRRHLRHIVRTIRRHPSGYDARRHHDLLARRRPRIRQSASEKVAELGNGRYYYTEDPEDIPEFFLEETKRVTKTVAVEKEIKPRVLRRGRLLADSRSIRCRGSTVTNAAAPRPTSEVFITADKKEPLLARWRYGLGRASALLTDSGAAWARDWRRWPELAPLLERVVRGTMADQALRDFRIAVESRPGGARVMVDARDPYGHFVNNLELRLVVRDENDVETEHTLTQTRPGGYETFLAGAGEGAYAVSIASAGEPGGKTGGAGQIRVAGPTEFISSKTNRALLEDVVAVGGGVINPTPDQLFRKPEQAVPARKPLRPYLLAAALATILVALVIRRSA